jgi:hypothetical protein
LVLGTLALKGRRLSLEVNSTARAECGRALLESALAGLVGLPLTEWTDLEQMQSAERPLPEPGRPVGSRDIGWMWHELGVEAQRHSEAAALSANATLLLRPPLS